MKGPEDEGLRCSLCGCWYACWPEIGLAIGSVCGDDSDVQRRRDGLGTHACQGLLVKERDFRPVA